MTQEEYQRVMGTNPSEFSATGKSKDKVAGQDTKRFPVETVSWDDAVEFCRKLSEMPQERAAGRTVSAAVGSAVGVCVPRGEHGSVQFQFGRQSGFPRNTRRTSFPTTGGSAAIPLACRTRWVGSGPTHGDCMICTATCGSGVRIATTKSIMRSRLRTIRRGLPVARTACLAAVAGSVRRRGTAGRRAATDDEPGIRLNGLGFRVSLVLPDTVAERAKMSPATDAAQPSGGLTANKPSPAVASPDSQSPVHRPTVGSLVAADGKWQLPPAPPPPAVAPFDAAKAKEHQEAWAKHLGVPVEITNSIGMKLVLIPPGEFMMGSPKELIEEELKST